MKIDFIGRKFVRTLSLNIHSHNTWEIIMVNKGTGAVIADGKEHPFRKGSVICIPPDTPHHNIISTTCVHTIILTPDFKAIPGDKVVVFEDDSGRTIRNLFDVIMCKFYSSESGKNEIISRLGDVLSMIIKEMIYTGYHFSDVENVKNAMITNFADPDFTVGKALENTNYSEAHFRKLFQNEMGMPPVKYLLELRLASAAMQLRKRADSKMSVASIAAESGFNDQGYFSRKFKEKYGVTPREYCMKHS